MNHQTIRRVLLPTAAALALSVLSSCGLTRTEKDAYTITDVDTTTRRRAVNAPGERDNGAIFPSPVVTTVNRQVRQKDSVYEREYPDFIRFAVFESASLLGSGPSDTPLAPGLFGLYGLFNPNFGVVTPSRPQEGVFTGAMYRLLTAEWRLRWFRDAANWSIGTSAIEIWAPQLDMSQTLFGIAPIHIKKRFYLREEIPYIALTPSFSVALLPSQYIHLGGALEVGSIGGLNLRAIAGYVAGQNGSMTRGIRNDLSSVPQPEGAVTVSFPYVGLDLSVLDFHNLVRETRREWREHEHSGWEVGVAEIGGVMASGNRSIFSDAPSNTSGVSIRGAIVRLAPASIALPFIDTRLALGTSVINITAVSKDNFGIGVLPFRLSFHQQLLPDELFLVPFVEYNYWPSSYLHLGTAVKLSVSQLFNMSLSAGYATGAASTELGSGFGMFGNTGSFSGGYLALNIGILSRLFHSEELRYNR